MNMRRFVVKASAEARARMRDAIKCDDNSRFTVNIDNLELGEPRYELRDDDPETPDQWVLIIGKNPTEHRNYNLWYYMDSTDADPTSVDVNNPDHVDIAEESTMDDYGEIQLSSDIKCSEKIQDKHGNQIDLITI